MTILIERTIEQRGGIAWREPLLRFDTLPEAQAWVRREYRGCKSEGPVFVDTKSRGTIQTGRIYRRKGEGRHWVTFSRVLSETERTAESVDIGRRKPEPPAARAIKAALDRPADYDPTCIFCENGEDHEH